MAKHYFGMRLASGSIAWVKQVAFPFCFHPVVTTAWAVEGLNNTKREGKRILSVCHLIDWTGASVFFCPQTRTSVKPLDLDWNYTTSFFGFSACRWQIVKLLSFHNDMSQFLIVNWIHTISSVSLKNPNNAVCYERKGTITSTCVAGANPYVPTGPEEYTRHWTVPSQNSYSNEGRQIWENKKNN